MLCRFSPPEQLHSDQGRQFESELLNKICTLLHITNTCIMPYYPQCNGMVQRFNLTLLDMLSTTVGNHQANWQQHIRKLCLAYNSSIHSSTGFSPFLLMFGCQIKLSINLMYGTNQMVSQTTTEYAQSLKQALQEAYVLVWEQVRPNIEDRTIVQAQAVCSMMLTTILTVQKTIFLQNKWIAFHQLVQIWIS